MDYELKSIFKLKSERERYYLTENELEIRFSLKQILYYNYFRSITPKFIRKKIQEKSYKNIKFNKNFIWEDYVKIVESSPDKEHRDFVQKAGLKKSKVESLFGKENSCAIVITHDVEEQNGFNFIPNLTNIDKKYGFVSSFNIVPYKYKIDEGILELIRKSGCEVGIHGYNHDGKLYMNENIFSKRVPFINEAIKKYNAVGFRSPMVHRNLRWQQKLNIEYDASCFDYDTFQPFPGGTGSIWPFQAGKFIEMPYTLPQDHTMFYVLKVKDITIWKNKIEWILKNNGMVLLLTHPDYLNDKKNMKMYEELLDYLNQVPRAWRGLPMDLARRANLIMNA